MKFINYKDSKLSKLSLGTVQFGLDYGIANQNGKTPINNVQEIINYITKMGINCFDTAAAYGDSEKVLGITTKEKKGLNLISKISSDDLLNNNLNIINKSLKSLNTNRLFASLLHDSDLLYKWKEEYNNIISNLINSNKIKYFGVSIYTQEDFDLALENENINIIQIPFNLFDHRALTYDWFGKAKVKGKLLFIRSIYLQGLLLMDKDNIPSHLNHAKKHIESLDKLCIKLNYSKNKLALNFINTVAKDSIILFGCDNLIQAKENIENFNNLDYLSEEILNEINTLFKDIDISIFNPSLWEQK